MDNLFPEFGPTIKNEDDLVCYYLNFPKSSQNQNLGPYNEDYEDFKDTIIHVVKTRLENIHLKLKNIWFSTNNNKKIILMFKVDSK